MDKMEERQVEKWKDMKNMEEKVSWIVIRNGQYGRKACWIVKRYEKYGRNPSWIVKRYGKYRRKLWKYMEIMEERQVE